MFTDRKHILVRKWSNRVLREIAPKLQGDVVNVSGWDDRDKEGGHYRDYFTGAKSFIRTNYPGHRGFQGGADEVQLDLCEPLPDDLRRRFDVALNHTTLEHIFDARTAFANLCDMSRDAVIVIVPFSQVQHESESYGDYWRFTPSCLRKLFEENGMQVVYEAESPHRDASIYLLFVGSRQPERYAGLLPRYRRIREAGSWIGRSYLISGAQFTRHRAGMLVKRIRDGKG